MSAAVVELLLRSAADYTNRAISRGAMRDKLAEIRAAQKCLQDASRTLRADHAYVDVAGDATKARRSKDR